MVKKYHLLYQTMGLTLGLNAFLDTCTHEAIRMQHISSFCKYGAKIFQVTYQVIIIVELTGAQT